MTNIRLAFSLGLGLGALALPAFAAITPLGPASPINSTITGIGNLSFTPTPATQIEQVTDPEYSSDFPNQSTTTVLNGVAAVFGVPAASLAFIQGAVNP